MKKLALLLSLTSLSTFAEDDKPEQQYSFGVGMGSIYSGLGANVALLSKTDMKYISVGCVGYSSLFGSSCGFGAGWIVTDLFDFDSNNHGFGIYATIVGHESYGSVDDSGILIHDNDYYGVGVNYSYFMNGIDKSGFTFGASIHATNADFASTTSGFFQVGYQF